MMDIEKIIQESMSDGECAEEYGPTAIVYSEMQVRAAIITAVERLQAELLCDACLGQPLPDGGKCGCNGTGKISVMLDTVRHRLVEKEAENAKLRETLEDVRDSGLLRGLTKLHEKMLNLIHEALAAQEKG